MADRLDPVFVRAQIENLRVAYPHVEDDDEQWLMSLESETDLHELLTVAINRLQDANAKINGIGQLISDLKVRQDRFDQRADAMKSLMFKLMSAADVRKLELPQATLSIRAGPPKVIVTDQARLPPDCIRTRIEPDKQKIKERIQRGETVAGAEMSNSAETLAVRVK